MKNYILILFLGFNFISFSQKVPKFQTVKIQTTAECGDCKDRIEGILNYTKGVKFAELDVPSKILTVKFSPAKIDLQSIKVKVSELGYDADEVKANPIAQKKLPLCCQPGGMEKMNKP